MPEIISGMSTVENPSSPIAAAQALAAGRPKYRYTIPESARAFPTDPKQVVFKMVTSIEEEQALATAGGVFGLKFYNELTKHSIVAADGRPVTWENDGKEAFFEACSPKVRDLLMKTYKKLNMASDKEEEDFFGSQEIVL